MSRTPVPIALSEAEFRFLPIALTMSTKLSPEANKGRAGNCFLKRTVTALLTRIGLPILAAVLVAGLSAQAQSLAFGAQAVGQASAAQTVTVHATATGAVARVKVLTLGAPNLDFADVPASSSSNCATASFSASGGSCTESVTFTPVYPGSRLGAVVLFDAAGDVLGTAYLSGTGTGGLGVLTPGNTIAVAGVYKSNTSRKNEIPATQANLDQPAAIAFDGAGNMYIAESAANDIRMISPPAAGAVVGTIHLFAGTGDATYTGDGGPAKFATLSNPSGVAVDGAGNVYIADTNNNAIRKVTAVNGTVTSDSIITTVAGPGTEGTLGDGGPATAAYLNAPQGVTVDAQGNLFIADTSNQLIRRVDAVTGIITTAAGNGLQSGKGDSYGTYSGDGKPAIDAGLSRPYSVAFDASGDMYIPDSGNHRIRKVTAVNGAITSASIIGTVAGTGFGGSSGDGGKATAALLNTPSGVAVDPAGNLYIADTANNRIRKLNFSSGDIATLVENFNSKDGGTYYLNASYTPEPLLIYAPEGIALDGTGDLYFADYYFMLVQKIESNTAFLSFLSTPVQAGDTSSPQAQTVENDGNAALTLSAFTPDANTAIDPGTTTCVLNGTLAAGADCNVGVIFAPAVTLVFPAGVTSEQVDANVDVYGNTVGYLSDTVNFPLDIVAIGEATAVDSTQVTLAGSPSPSNFGQKVTFTASVTAGAGAGTPTGTVAFANGAASLGAPVPLTNGVAMLNTATLPVGANSITATYTPAASSVFLPSLSNTWVQYVDEQTATGLTSSGTPSVLGASVTFTATVKISGGGGVPLDGNVTFYDGATALTSIAINGSGVAVYPTSALAEGSHAITAAYGGDAAKYILGSTSPGVSQDVQATSGTVVVSSSPSSTYGVSVTFTATVTTKGTIAPTGAVNFLDGGQQIGSINLVGNTGQATVATSSLAVGQHTITAVYVGDVNNSGSTSAPITQTVNQAQTVTTVAAVPSPGIAGAPVAITATVKVQVGSAAITGTVTFTNGATTLGTAQLGGQGTATISPTLAPGNYSIVATYGGNANGAGSASAALPLTVQIATTKTVVSATPSPALVEATVTFTATVTGNGGTPTGAVSFLSDGVSIGSAPLKAGTATFTYSALAAGTHAITASYAGDANDAASASAAFSETVGTISTVTDLGASTTTGVTPQVILVATVLGASGPTPTGTVTFYNGATEVGASALDSSGVATLVPSLPTGTYTIVAKYGGDALHSPSTSSAVSISSVPVGFNLAVTPSTVTVATTQSATVSVALTSTDGFTDKIGLGCASLPAGVTCHFSTPAIVLPADGAVKAQLTIDTNNPLGGGSTAMNSPTAGRGIYAAGLFLPLGLLFGGIFWRFRKRYALAMTTGLVLLLSAAAMLVTGCSGISQGSAAPGTYVIQVTGIGAASNITHYENVTLTITK